MALTLALPFALFAVAAAFHASYAGYGIAPFDLGILVADTDRVLRGEVFGHDFMAPYGPASYYVLAPVLRILGRSLYSVAFFLAALRAALDVATYLLARRLIGPWFALLPFGLALVAHGSFHKSFLVVAQVLCLIALTLAANGDRRRGFVVAGALCAAAWLFRYDVGVFGALAFLVVVALRPRPERFRAVGLPVACATVGGLLVMVPVAAILIARGLDVPWWWDHVWQRIRVQEGIQAKVPDYAAALRELRLAPLVVGGWLLLGWILPPLASAITFLRDRRRTADLALVSGMSCFGLLMMNQTRLIPSLNHFLQVSTTPYILLGLVLATAVKPWLARGGWRAGGCVALLVLPWLITTWRMSVTRDSPYPGSFVMRSRNAMMLPGPRGGVLAPRNEVLEIMNIVRLVQERTAETDPILTGHYCPLFYFLCDRRPAIPFAEPSYYYDKEKYQREVIDATERSQPKIFIYYRGEAATYQMHLVAPIFFGYLQQHYRPLVDVGPYTVLERVP
jgi:hypothetical protein